MRVCPTCQTRYLGDEPFCSKDGHATEATDETVHSQNLIGTRVGNYQITSLVGEGGMGVVYRAEHPAIGRVVAIKVLHEEYTGRRDAVERFFTEAKSVNQIRHENIVDIIDFGLLLDQRPYYVMEYLEGSDLDQYLSQKKQLSIKESIEIMMPVLSALQAAHDEGIIHRDLKPENIFLAKKKRGGRTIRLLDFGIAKLLDVQNTFYKTRPGALIGTPAYMSPEQAEASTTVDHRADVYAAGIIMYELLAGVPPFSGKTTIEIVLKQWKEPPVPLRHYRPDLSENIESLVFSALEKDREKRIQTAQEFRAFLQTLQAKPANVSQEVFSPSPEEKTQISSSRLAIPSLSDLSPSSQLTQSTPKPIARSGKKLTPKPPTFSFSRSKLPQKVFLEKITSLETSLQTDIGPSSPKESEVWEKTLEAEQNKNTLPSPWKEHKSLEWREEKTRANSPSPFPVSEEREDNPKPSREELAKNLQELATFSDEVDRGAPTFVGEVSGEYLLQELMDPTLREVPSVYDTESTKISSKKPQESDSEKTEILLEAEPTRIEVERKKQSSKRSDSSSVKSLAAIPEDDDSTDPGKQDSKSVLEVSTIPENEFAKRWQTPAIQKDANESNAYEPPKWVAKVVIVVLIIALLGGLGALLFGNTKKTSSAESLNAKSQPALQTLPSTESPMIPNTRPSSKQTESQTP